MFFFAVDECDWIEPPCRTVNVTNAAYGTCDGAYQLATFNFYQRPVYVKTGTIRYIRYHHGADKWVIGSTSDMYGGGFYLSEKARLCHPEAGFNTPGGVAVTCL